MMEKTVTKEPVNPKCDGTHDGDAGRTNIHCNGGMTLIDSYKENGHSVKIYKCGKLICGETTKFTIIKGREKMEFEEIRKLVYTEYVKNGYLDKWTVPEEYQEVYNLAEVGLFHTEAAESQEAVRKTNYENLGEECADVVIRVMNFCSRVNIDLEKAILDKHEKNLKRGKLHGKNI